MTQEQEPRGLSGRDRQALEIGRRELADIEADLRMRQAMSRFLRQPHGMILAPAVILIVLVGSYALGREMRGEEEKERVGIEEFRETPTPTQIIETATPPAPFYPTPTPVPGGIPIFPPAETPTAPSAEIPLELCESPLAVGETCFKENLAVTLKQATFHDTSIGEEMELEWEFKNISNGPIQLSGLSKANWKTTDNLGRNFVDRGQTTLQRFSSCKFIADDPSFVTTISPGQATILCMSITPQEGLFNPSGLEEIKVTLNTKTIENATWMIEFQQ